MQSSTDLLDSKSFCRIADAFCESWQGGDPNEQAKALDELLGAAIGKAPKMPAKRPVAESEPAKVKMGRKKGTRNQSNVVKKALQKQGSVLVDPDTPLTDAQIASIKAQDALNAPDPWEEALKSVIEDVIKPKWNDALGADGQRHFFVKLQRENKATPTSAEKWITALRTAGLEVDPKLFNCRVDPDGSYGFAGMMKVTI